jgi:hypothetical protein
MDVTLENGMTVTTYSPPSGFNPLQATNAELVRVGFPPRPENPELLAHWNQLFQDLNGKLNYITPTFENMPHVREPRLKRSPRTQTVGDTITNDHWSGVQVFPPSSSFCALTAAWWVPTISAPDTTQDYWLMTWIGIDGEESDDVLCQIGIVQNINLVAEGAQQCYPFFEWWPAGPSYGVNNFDVQPGNLVTLWLSTQGYGSTQATGFYANRSTGTATTVTFNDKQNNNPLIGHCAEWIVERPLNNNVPELLADYGQTYFFQCQADYGDPNEPTPVTPAATDATVITMVDGNTTLSQATVAPSPGTEIHFQYAGPSVSQAG